MLECFPEPQVADPTPLRPGESRVAWLSRSTWDRARELRRFYNENLASLPSGIATRLCHELKKDRSEAKHFELVVGRFLQVLGARALEYEAPGSEGRRVDWLAQFDDGSVSVEVTVPVVNAVVGETVKGTQRAIDMVVRAAPPSWHVLVAAVPNFRANEPMQRFRSSLPNVFSSIPPGVHGARVTVHREYGNGSLEVELFGASDGGPARYAGGPAVGYVDDTSTVVQRAVAGKRLQARGAVKPVLAAIYTGGIGTYEIDKFDIALFGRTVVQMGAGRRWLEPSGLFRPGDKDPTFAGALVFANLGMRGGPDPILYRHPRYAGDLPAPLMQLRQRDARENDVGDVPAARDGTLMKLGWPRG